MCGVFGLIDPGRELKPTEVVSLGTVGAWAIQHRGTDSVGESHTNGNRVWVNKAMQKVDAFMTRERIRGIVNNRPRAICFQVRYSTSGDASLINAQPFYMRGSDGTWSFASNGDVPNLKELSRAIKKKGVILYSQNDAEYLLCLIDYYYRRNGTDIIEAIREMMRITVASYSACFMTGKGVYLIRDPWANRPLWLARFGKIHVWASETCAIDSISWVLDKDPEMMREVRPGEIVRLRVSGEVDSIQGVAPKPFLKRCVFCPIYFARPDSLVPNLAIENYPSVVRLIDEGKVKDNGAFRVGLGERLAEQASFPEDAFVMSVPASGDQGAVGFEDASGLMFRIGLITNKFVGRTFMLLPGMRSRAAQIKFNPPWNLFQRKKKVVVVDDSIVRLTNMPAVCRMLRRRGVEEVHVRITSPPVVGPCPYGIATPTKRELVANRHLDEGGNVNVDEIAAKVGADSLEYLSLANLRECVSRIDDPRNYCFACFDRKYWHRQET